MNEFSYRRAAVEGASSVALVIMLYDRLIADMQRAISALQRNEIETRCSELKHALLILQQLEGSLDHERGGVGARNLAALYSHARAEIMEAQFTLNASRLEKLIGHFLDVKGAWQKVDSGSNAPGRQAEYGGAQPQKSHDAFSGESSLSCTV